MRQEGEPSVEEILASIKQVIARDNREAASAQRRKLASEFVEPGVTDEAVLELGAEAELEGSEAEEDADALVDPAARASMRDSLAALALLAEPSAPPQIVRSGETSLEGLTRELLRPMLAEWLDRHLPGMVEKLVAAEIARIAGKKG